MFYDETPKHKLEKTREEENNRCFTTNPPQKNSSKQLEIAVPRPLFVYVPLQPMGRGAGGADLKKPG